MRNFGTVLVASAMVFAFGCDDGRDPGTDAGGIVLMDSGPMMMGTDSGPMMMGTDSGPGMTTCTENMPLPQTIPAPTTAACAAATNTCLMGAMTQAEFQACIDADPSATAEGNPCQTCLSIAQTACINANGCQANWTTLACCVNTTCPSDPMLGCISTTCAGANSAWEGCADTAVMSCGAALGVCFM